MSIGQVHQEVPSCAVELWRCGWRVEGARICRPGRSRQTVDQESICPETPGMRGVRAEPFFLLVVLPPVSVFQSPALFCLLFGPQFVRCSVLVESTRAPPVLFELLYQSPGISACCLVIYPVAHASTHLKKRTYITYVRCCGCTSTCLAKHTAHV